MPAFGFNFAFPYPDDWIRTQLASTSPDLDPPLLQMRDEGGVIYANATPLYLSYISADPQYGMKCRRLAGEFLDYVTLRLARYACLRITNDKEMRELLRKDEDRARADREGERRHERSAGPAAGAVLGARAPRRLRPGGLWFGSGGSGGTGEN